MQIPPPTEVLDTISHGVRTLLMVVTTNAQLLQRQQQSELVRRSTEDIIRSTRRLLRLHDDLADVYRIQTGALLVQRQPAALRDLLQEIVDEMQGSFGERRLTLELATGLPPVLVDQQLLTRALRHLLDNAAQHSGSAEAVVLRAVHDDKVRIEVSDRGCGIRPQDLERVFAPFVRLPGARGGVGLGLYLVRCYVEAMAGRVEVRSEPGAGSTFAIELPAVR